MKLAQLPVRFVEVVCEQRGLAASCKPLDHILFVRAAGNTGASGLLKASYLIVPELSPK